MRRHHEELSLIPYVIPVASAVTVAAGAVWIRIKGGRKS